MTVGLRDALAKASPKSDFQPTAGWVEELRATKDRDEIAATRHACQLARRAFDVIKAKIVPEMTELEAAAELEYQARRFGGRGLSSPQLLASVGARRCRMARHRSNGLKRATSC